MDSALRVDLFCEDRGHEQLVRPLIQRLAREQGVAVHVESKNARGGHGQALTEFVAWQKAVAQGLGDEPTDLLVIVIDANCQGWSTARSQILERVDEALFPRHVVGCPDPHVERWCLADPPSFHQVVGASPPADPGKCERHLYKHALRTTILDAGVPILVDEMDLAPDLVDEMDLFRAGKNQASLKHFVDDLKVGLK